jgi:UDP-glucose 4-epimerase
MHAANVEGTRNMLLARPGAFVLASSVSVYGAWPANPVPMDESHRPRPNAECPYAQQKLASERACAELSGRWTAVRLSAVLGPHADVRVARAVHGYRWVIPAVAGVRQALQWLDEADAVEGLLAAGRSLLGGSGVDGEVVNLATSDWLGAPEVAEVSGGHVARLPREMIMVASELAKNLGVTPFGADRAALIGGPLAVSAEKAVRLLGWRATKSSADVLAAALQRGWHASPRNRALSPVG